jgi:hypothetical protein
MVLMCGWLANGQTSVVHGELHGLLTDPANSVVPGVTLTLKGLETGFRRVAATNSFGEYRFLLLPVGVYDLTFEHPSFQTTRRDAVHVLVGQATAIDVQLALAVRAEEVTVSAVSEAIDPQRTNPASFVNEARIRNLPIDRRDYLTFVLLSPGIADARLVADSVDLRVKQTPTSDLSFFGSNGRGNFITVDGGEMVDGGGGVRSNVSQEAVQEFQVNRATYSAEIGAATGGAVNIVTRAGGNKLHGTAFWFSRHQSLDAANPFATLVSSSGVRRVKPPSRRQQVGGSIGGPLRRDRTFAFAAFESLIRRESSVVSVLPDYSIFGPTPAQESVLAAIPPPQAAVLRSILTASPATRRLFEINGGVHPFSTDSYKFNARIDHYRGAADQFFLRADIPRLAETNANVQALVGASRGLETRQFDPTVVLGWTHSFSSNAVNEARLQANYRKFQMESREKFGPELRISGFGVFNRDIFLPSRNIERRIELKDNFHYVAGRHVLRAGGQFWFRGILADSEIFFPGRFTFGDLPGSLLDPALPPNFTINALQAFNLGLAQTFIMGSGASALGAVYPYGAAYLQDSWRASPLLTLDLGLRYEIDVRKSPLPTDKNNFAPRFGFAWNPDGAARNVLRGGFGLFYGLGNFGIDYTVTALNEIQGQRQIAQVFTSILAPGPAAAPNVYSTLRAAGVIGVPTPARPLTPADLEQFGLRFVHSGARPPFTVLFEPGPGFSSPYSMQASLGLQRQLARDFTLELSGLWSRTRQLPRSRDINLLPAPVDPASGIRVWSDFSSFADPLLASRNVFESTAFAQYAAAIVEFNKRFSPNFDFGANYTFSRAIDDVLDYNYEFQAFDQTNLRAERGLASFHQKHKLVAWASGSLPAAFRLSAIVRANSGRPFNLLAGFDLNQDRNDLTDRPAFAGRNTGIGPAFFTSDLRLSRFFRLTESAGFELAAEGFNILNRLNFATVNNIVGNIAGPFNLQGRRDRLPTQPLGFTSAYEPRRLQLGVRFQF